MTDNPLSKLQEIVSKDPELVFGKLKKFISLSEESLANINNFIDFIRDGYVPVLYGNHQSHADSIVYSALTGQAISNVGFLKGFLCPVAASMETGDQNETVAGGVSIFLPIFEKKGFIMVPIVREDDRIKYGMTGSNLKAMERLLQAPRDSFGLAIFPEATVKGGRKKEDGSIYGMQQVVEGGKLLLRCMNFWKDQGKKTVFLPIGIENSYNLFSPDNYDISEDILDMITGSKQLEHLVKVKIGEPFISDTAQKDLDTVVDAKNQEHVDYFMKKVAILLPDEAKGYYL